MKTIYFFLLLFISQPLLAQYATPEQSQLRLKARRATQAEKHEEALNTYKKLVSLENPANSDYLKCAEAAFAVQQATLGLEYLQCMVEEHGTSKEDILDILKRNELSQLTTKVNQEYNEWLKKFYQTRPNLEAYFLVQQLIERDQLIRRLDDYYLGITEEMRQKAADKFFEAQDKNDTKSMQEARAILFPEVDEDFKQMKSKMMLRVDSLNVIALKEILTEYGWQPNAWLLLWHQRGTYGQNTPAWQFLKAVIDREIAVGKLPPSFWAPFEDFASYRTTGVTKFGYWPGKVPKAVNANRMQIGLAPLSEEEMAERNSSSYGGAMY